MERLLNSDAERGNGQLRRKGSSKRRNISIRKVKPDCLQSFPEIKTG